MVLFLLYEIRTFFLLHFNLIFPTMKLTLISGLFIILLCRNINFTNAAEHTIFLIDDGFNPKSVTANIGDTVSRNTLMRS